MGYEVELNGMSLIITWQVGLGVAFRYCQGVHNLRAGMSYVSEEGIARDEVFIDLEDPGTAKINAKLIFNKK